MHRYVWIVLMAAAVLFSFLKGGRAEKAYATMLVLGSFATRFTQDIAHEADPQYGILAVDFLFLAGVITMAMLTDRWWLLFAAGFQIVDVVTHAAMIADHTLHGRAYLIGLAIWSYLELGALVVGTWLYWRAKPRSSSLSRRR